MHMVPIVHAETEPDVYAQPPRLANLDREVSNLTDGLARLGSSPAIVAKIGEREEKISRLRARLDVLSVAPDTLDMEARRIEVAARKRVEELRRSLSRNPEEAQRAMEALLDGPVTFRPVRDEDGTGFEVEGTIATGELLTSSKRSVPKGI